MGRNSQEIFSQTARQAAVGASSVDASLGLDMNFLWERLLMSEEFSLIRASWAAGREVPYPTNAPFLAEQITDRTFWPEFDFTVDAPNQGIATVTSPTVRRRFPQFSDQNAVRILIDGNEALPAILAALDAASDHIHLDWFFFGPDEVGNEIVNALIAKSQSGVEVRLLFNHHATGYAGSLGAGFDVAAVRDMVQRLRAGRVRVARSEDAIPTNWRTLRSAEYRDRARKTLEHFRGRFRAGLTNLMSAADHQKIIVIDGTLSFCGGMNCAKNYLYHHPFDRTSRIGCRGGGPTRRRAT